MIRCRSQVCSSSISVHVVTSTRSYCKSRIEYSGPTPVRNSTATKPLDNPSIWRRDSFCPSQAPSETVPHPLASAGTFVLGLRCSWCPGSAPMPKLLGLYALQPAGAARAISKG
jgi:hypothetical protein